MPPSTQGDQRTVAAIMQTRLHTVSPELTLPELERRFLADRVSGYPVVERQALVGIVTRSDIVRQLSIENSLSEVMAEVSGVDGFRREVADPFTWIADRVGERIERMRVGDVMIRDVITVAPQESLSQAARLLLAHRVHRLVVVEGSRPVGIVTSLDFVRLVAEGSA